MSITWVLWSLRQGIPCKSCQTDPLLPTVKRPLMSGLPFIELLVRIKRRAQNYKQGSGACGNQECKMFQTPPPTPPTTKLPRKIQGPQQRPTYLVCTECPCVNTLKTKEFHTIAQDQLNAFTRRHFFRVPSTLLTKITGEAERAFVEGGGVVLITSLSAATPPLPPTGPDPCLV